MSHEAENFLAAFHALPPEDQHEVTVAILREFDRADSAEEEVLRNKIQAGINSPAVPADEVLGHLRQTAERLAGQQE